VDSSNPALHAARVAGDLARAMKAEIVRVVVLGSTSQRVVSHAPCPVLIVR